ncbi:hypothetical protein P148_SR1C00001G0198 [candidate division SR1 bacterium RAAC1_SR1_1]|nr:hypothetical protein P148_SR1C00001G0198 [candidate division SR1 bacterium RAAC1_SR1_1]
MIKNLKKRLIQLRKSDSNLNMIVIVIAVVMIWRGVRGILDTFLFPNYPLVSYIVSLGLGIVILLLDNQKLDELSHH